VYSEIIQIFLLYFKQKNDPAKADAVWNEYRRCTDLALYEYRIREDGVVEECR
jgi:hypothetical protein